MSRADPQFRLRVVKVGIGVTLGLGSAGLIYTVLTWDQPHRFLLAAISIAAGLDGLVIGLLRKRISESPMLDGIFATWNIAHVLAAGWACYLDGGPTSPFVMVLFVSVVFAAVSLARRYVAAVAAVDIATLLVIAGATDSWHAELIPLVAALVAVGVVAAAVAGEQSARLIAVQEARTEMLRRLARVIEFRDTDTGTHVERMSEYCALIASRLAWSQADVDRLRAAAQMHDIGKVAVPDHILLKPGPLTAEERTTMERHTTVGHEMLAGSSSQEIELAAEIALTHHEHFDGSGYPSALSGADIPMAGRIVAVADVFDALTSDRVYRPAMSVGEALEILHDGRGTHFDPKVLAAFNDALDDILAARARDRERGPRALGHLRSVRSRESVSA